VTSLMNGAGIRCISLCHFGRYKIQMPGSRSANFADLLPGYNGLCMRTQVDEAFVSVDPPS
jgi:hypothetical protein